MADVAILVRPAVRDDVPEIVRMLADDALGATREAAITPLPQSYYDAFDGVSRDPNNELVVADIEGAPIGVMQLTFIQSLSHQGSWRMLIESVRVAADMRSRGIGGLMIGWALARARQRGCRLAQLTSHKSRTDAIRFYKRLGFVASHEGLKLELG
jgi:GNAT superfamily N-acetyltransferase